MSLALKLALARCWWRRRWRRGGVRRRLPEAAGAARGPGRARARALRLLIVGDSSAAGVGVRTQDEALAGHLTRTLAQRSARRVHWQLHRARAASPPRRRSTLLQQRAAARRPTSRSS